jgi:hypothetical protein
MLMTSGHTYPAMAMSMMGFYCLLGMIILLHFAPAGRRVTPSDLSFLAMCGLGLMCLVALLVHSFTEVASNWLVMGSFLFVLSAQWVAGIVARIFPSPVAEGEKPAG